MMTKQVYGYIYMTTNLVNGKKYIGQKASSSFVEDYKGSGTYLKNAINKYGIENFKTEILKWCYDQEELDSSERFFIEQNNAVESDDFYNLAKGGSFGNARKGSKFSEQARKKMSEINKGEKNAMWGKTHSEESRKKISDHHADFKGEKSPSYNRVCINDGNKVKYVKKENLNEYISDGWEIGTTEEMKQKISKTNKGRKHSEETKKKMSLSQSGERNGMYGKHASLETRQKMSESRFGRKWINNRSENKFVKSEEVQYYLSQGWKLGKLVPYSEEVRKKQSEGTKNTCWVHKENENKRIRLEDKEKHLSEGWILGMTNEFKSKLPISKKGHKQTKEQVENRRIALKDRKCVNNGIINKYIIPEQVESYLSSGYVLGKIKKAVS